MNKEQYQQLVSLYTDLETIVEARVNQLYETQGWYYRGITAIDDREVTFAMGCCDEEFFDSISEYQIRMTDDEWKIYMENLEKAREEAKRLEVERLNADTIKSRKQLYETLKKEFEGWKWWTE